MTDEVKKPLPGEWWRNDECNENAFICGYDVDGDPVFQSDGISPARIDRLPDFLQSWRHVPDCTGFDWTPPDPVESPDDWVTQDRVPARPGIDERSYDNDDRWDDACEIKWGTSQPALHGAESITGAILHLRCRRKDLPPLPDEKKTRIVTLCEFVVGSLDRFYVVWQSRIPPGDIWDVVLPTGNTREIEIRESQGDQ